MLRLKFSCLLVAIAPIRGLGNFLLRDRPVETFVEPDCGRANLVNCFQHLIHWSNLHR